MNYCFRVSSRDGKHSVVLKYAEEKAKVLPLPSIVYNSSEGRCQSSISVAPGLHIISQKAIT